VKSTLQQVENDAVDAGVVYVTDVKSAGTKVKGVEIPADVNASTDYPIAVIKASGNPVDRTGLGGLRSFRHRSVGPESSRLPLALTSA
jgi:Rieske Fe-S protein